jgi:hypothetical protein
MMTATQSTRTLLNLWLFIRFRELRIYSKRRGKKDAVPPPGVEGAGPMPRCFALTSPN